MQLTVESRRGAGHVRSEIESASRSAFASVVLDVDRGISTIDGMDWLAARRGDLVARKVAALTTHTRDGGLDAERAYADRLTLVRPRRDEVTALSRAYTDAIAADCVDAINRFRRAGVRVLIVSRGLRPAMYGVIYRLGLDASDVHAVDVRFDALGAYAGFDRTSSLLTADGKRAVLTGLHLDGPVLVVGRDPTERQVDSFSQLASMVLP
jgi:phosphoserine phosphatase